MMTEDGDVNAKDILQYKRQIYNKKTNDKTKWKP